MPLGSAAQYVALNMTIPDKGYSSDECYLTFVPGSPQKRLIDRGYWWPYPQDGFSPTDTGIKVCVPDDWIVAPPSTHNLPNRGTAALLPDGRAQEFQYTVRESNGSDISIHDGVRATYDLKGDGLTGNNNGFGAHGGSGMTAIGGTIRAGELLASAGPIRHALAITMNTAKWATKQGGNITNGFRWPAIAADNYWNNDASGNGYGTWEEGIHSKDGLGMGTLLALPQSFDTSTQNFETTAGQKIALALKHYGAYVVDSVMPTWDDMLINMEEACYIDAPELHKGEDSASSSLYRRDMNKIVPSLCVIDNNTSSSIGGGGTPLQPLAPDFT